MIIMTDKKTAEEGVPVGKELTGDDEHGTTGGDNMVYDSGIFLTETDVSEVQYGTRIDAPLVAGAKSGDDWPVAFTSQLQGAFQQFADKPHRDKWTKLYKSRLFNTIAVVGKGENGYPSIYHWTGTKKDGSDGSWEFAGYFGGVVITDVAGAIPRINSTIVLGDDFQMQEAGDQGFGVLIQLSDKAKQAASGTSTGGLIEVGTYKQPGTFSKVSTLELEWPLKAWTDADANPDGTRNDAARVSMDHSAFEPLHKPGFLAYVGYDTEVMGKVPKGYLHDKDSHHRGAIWFDEIVVPDNAYISKYMSEKCYSIEEADELDPNVSGGTDYLIAFRAAMKGIAPEDGFVRAYIYDQSVNPFMVNGYMQDTNGQPMVVERHYKQGDNLGTLDIIGVVNAKGQQKFSCHIIDNFKSDMVNLTDPYYGVTGLMVQALTSTSRTGLARLTFAQDTKQNIVEAKKYLGADLFSIDWMVKASMPVTVADAGLGMTQNDGEHFYNLSRMKAGVVDGHVVLQDDGSAICDWSFGKIFDSETTRMLRGKDLTLKTKTTNQDTGLRLMLVSWTGKPDQFSKEIFESRNNGTPVFQAGWAEDGNGMISEDVTAVDQAQTIAFTVPANANNFAIIMLPVTAEQPMLVKIKQFTVDVHDPFNGYLVRSPELLNEQHLVYSPNYKRFTQDTQGYVLLRYTVNDKWTPMPVGIPKAGSADVTIDTSKNKVGGSQAKGGEGVLKFNKEGLVTASIDFNAWNEQGTDDDITVQVVMVDPDTGEIRPDDPDLFIGSGGITVPAGSKGSQHRFNIGEKQVEVGEEWAILAKSNKADGAFLECTSDAKPLMDVSIKFKELTTDGTLII